MSIPTVTILGLGIATYLLKSAGPLLLGGRPIPDRLSGFANSVPTPLLAALVLTSVAVSENSFVVDPRLAGLAGAAVALRLRAPFAGVVLVAAATTAFVRALV